MGAQLPARLDTAHSLEVKDVLSTLRSSREGLTQEEADRRLEEFGRNSLPTKPPPSAFTVFLRQILSPFSLVLGLAFAASLFFGELTDTIVIFSALALDATIGFIQEYKASRTFQELLTKTTLHITVIREGEMQEIDSELLVPGDIMVIKYGDKIPADGRIITESNFMVDEAILTGESLPQEKHPHTVEPDTVVSDRENMVFMGTNATQGSCNALVTATGNSTELGKINEFVTSASTEKTFLQKEINRIGNTIGIFLAIVLTVITIVGLIRGNPAGDIIHASIALAVSAIPESLAVVVTIIFAIGMRRIFRSKGLIKRLMATETLGRTEVLCMDKTGTLTEGTMTVDRISMLTEVIPVSDLDPDNPAQIELATAATLCNTAYQDDGEYKGPPTDTALLKFGHHFGLSREKLKKKLHLREFIPFDSETKMSIAYVSQNGTSSMYICGSPEAVLGLSDHSDMRPERTSLTDEMKKSLLSLNASLGEEGYRIVAAAKKECHSDDCAHDTVNKLTFLGLLIITDPIRKSAKETVRLVQRAGVKLVMVTGDHPKTALNIAEQVGITSDSSAVMTGEELATITEDELAEKIEDIAVFARVTPFDKVKIINAWKKRGKIVAMTGDGVNDAPALTLADIGIALGSGTEVAKEAADLVLLNDNLQTILDAVRQGRGILDNIKKTVTYLLADPFTEVIVVGTAILMGLPLPLLPAQILWINIVEDGLPDIALSFEPVEDDAMKKSPKIYKTEILDREVRMIVLVISAVNILILFGLYFYYLNSGRGIDFTRTMVFMGSSIDSLFFAFACKSLRRPFWKTNIFSNKLLNIFFIAGLLLLIAAVYVPFLQIFLKTVPIGITEWALLLAIGFLNLLAIELVKHYFFDEGKLKHSLKVNPKK
jgi:P-type Ca2+ transporter type 2C